MHILLTDVLVCPRCGPAFGLILLADRIEARRVLEGRLGCSNCREQYRIVDGVADLCADDSGRPIQTEIPGNGDAVRIAGLLAVQSGAGYVLLAGDAAEDAQPLAALLEDVEVIALSAGDGGAGAFAARDIAGISRVAAETVPIATGRMSGVALTGARADALLDEAARTVRPTCRLLVDPAPPDARERLAAAGLRVLAAEGTTVLAIRG